MARKECVKLISRPCCRVSTSIEEENNPVKVKKEKLQRHCSFHARDGDVAIFPSFLT